MTRSDAVPARTTAARRPAWPTTLWLALRAALLTPLLLLAACQPHAAAGLRIAGVEAAPPRFTDGVFIAADGARLPLRRWLPAGAVKAVILALHGFNDYSNSFAAPARLWAARGIATYAYDQRGFGGAPGRGLWAGSAWLAGDAVTASRILRGRYPGRPLYLLGESMGGAVAILAATGAVPGVVAGPGGLPAAEADGVVLSGPAVWGRSTMDLLPKLTLFAGVRLFPSMVLTGRGLHIVASDNMPMLHALARDPMVIKGARIDTIYGVVNLMDDALAAAPHLNLPTLMMYGAHDEVVPRRPIAVFVARLPPDPAHRRTLAYYPKGYHMLLRDLEGPVVAGDVASWVLGRGGALPSRADATQGVKPWPPERLATAGALLATGRR